MSSVSFPRHEVGLGTAYERLAIYRLFDRWFQSRPVTDALEGPVDGMAGIAGLHLLGLARCGTRVCVSLPDSDALETVRQVYRKVGVEDRLEFACEAPDRLLDRSFDLVLTYNALPLIGDWRTYLQAMAQRARRYLLVSVTNPWSYGVGIRKLLRLLEKKRAPELFDHPSTRAAALEPELRKLGRIVEHTYLDCPWWPDLFVPTGERLLGASLRRMPLAGALLADRVEKKGPAPFTFGPDDYPLLEGVAGYTDMVAALRSHPVFDGSRTAVARCFAHHHAYLVERPSA